MAQTIKVLARGDILVLDVDYAKATGARKYVGRDTVTAWKEEELPAGCPRHLQANEFLEPGQPALPHTAYPATAEPQTVALMTHARDVRRGDLIPADKASADLCGVAFDHTVLRCDASAPAARGKAD